VVLSGVRSLWLVLGHREVDEFQHRRQRSHRSRTERHDNAWKALSRELARDDNGATRRAKNFDAPIHDGTLAP
jgi:hypothetical protein